MDPFFLTTGTMAEHQSVGSDTGTMTSLFTILSSSSLTAPISGKGTRRAVGRQTWRDIVLEVDFHWACLHKADVFAAVILVDLVQPGDQLHLEGDVSLARFVVLSPVMTMMRTL